MRLYKSQYNKSNNNNNIQEVVRKTRCGVFDIKDFPKEDSILFMITNEDTYEAFYDIFWN